MARTCLKCVIGHGRNKSYFAEISRPTVIGEHCLQHRLPGLGNNPPSPWVQTRSDMLGQLLTAKIAAKFLKGIKTSSIHSWDEELIAREIETHREAIALYEDKANGA